MGSYDAGKAEMLALIEKMARTGDRDGFYILDVGACDGKWSDMIHFIWNDRAYPQLGIDAVEAFHPNAARLLMTDLYKDLYAMPVENVVIVPGLYDLIIFGDVLEHLTVPAAQRVLRSAMAAAEDVLVGVPYQYEQDAIYGNPYERHLQPDLTREIVLERYPGLELIAEPLPDYGYFHKKGGPLWAPLSEPYEGE